MSNKTLTKPRMTKEEMTECYRKANPAFEPNHIRIGKFAKQNGYSLTKQMINRKYYFFYVKNELVNK